VRYALDRCWEQLDLNRIPEADMREFVAQHRAAAPAWAALRKRWRA
jgi:hypothetical protein